MAKLVSNVYGDALFEAAQEEHKLDSLYEEVQGLLAVLRENTEWDRLMAEPRITKEEKKKIITDIFGGELSHELTGLMVLLIEKGHYLDLPNVLEYFIARAKEEKGIGIAYVTTANDLSEEQKQATEQKLLDTTRYTTFEMHYQTDAALIGGMVIRVGDRVVDSSIKTKLYQLSKELRQVQV